MSSSSNDQKRAQQLQDCKEFRNFKELNQASLFENLINKIQPFDEDKTNFFLVKYGYYIVALLGTLLSQH